MLSKRLNKIREHVEEWCREHRIPTSTVCDTVGIQGVKIYERSNAALRQLFESLNPILKTDDVFLDVQKVRGGMILAFSVRSLSESEINDLLRQIGEVAEPMSFKERIFDAFVLPTTAMSIDDMPVDLKIAARKIAEDQYKVASAGATRSNQSSRQRNLHGMTMTHGGIIDGKKKAKTKTKKAKPQSESIARGYYNNTGSHKFLSQLSEALEGMATPDDVQPGEIFQKFARALSVLGQEMGIGPLQNQLKNQGINWKKSDDGQAIILYVINAQTDAPQPIARISAETLTKPSDFEEQLIHMIDFSRGEAPGAFKQKQEEIRAQEQAVREIARTVNPKDQSIINKMSGSNKQTQPATSATVQPATTAAAQQAASPKPRARA